jgi:hypothetical protein
VTPIEVVQRQLDAYNAQDLDLFCTFYASDAVIGDLNGAVTQKGLAEIRARYEKAWAQFPQNRAVALSRIVVGSTVIDHERVTRAPGGEEFEVAAIYTIRDGRIARVDFAR